MRAVRERKTLKGVILEAIDVYIKRRGSTKDRGR
jgi:hypothetical protein